MEGFKQSNRAKSRKNQSTCGKNNHIGRCHPSERLTVLEHCIFLFYVYVCIAHGSRAFFTVRHRCKFLSKLLFLYARKTPIQHHVPLSELQRQKPGGNQQDKQAFITQIGHRRWDEQWITDHTAQEGSMHIRSQPKSAPWENNCYYVKLGILIDVENMIVEWMNRRWIIVSCNWSMPCVVS